MLYTGSMFSDLALSDIIIVIISLIISIGFHEAMHAFVAHKLGDDTAAEQGRITLNPLKHVDLITTIVLPAVMLLFHLPPLLIAKPVPFDPDQVRHGEYGAAIMAVAGPLTNLGLAAIAALLIRLGIFDSSIVHILGLFTFLNIGLFVFNMLPIPPLDGSRLLYAFAPEPLQRVMLQIEQLGFVGLIFVLLVLSPVLNPILTTANNAIARFLLI
jgi:Zn-dependent protease